MKSGVYQIVNTVNGKFYIGSSIDLKKRKNKHFNELKHNKHTNVHLQSSVNKYGIENFHFEILATCPKEYCIKLEQFFINSLNPHYNIYPTAGSPLGMKHKIETIEKMRKAKIGKNIINVETMEIFDSIGEASRVNGFNYKTFARKLSGELTNNTPYQYLKKEWVKGYKTIIVDNKKMYYRGTPIETLKKIGYIKKVINTLTGEIFNTVKAAAVANRICYSTLLQRLKGKLTNDTPYQYLQKEKAVGYKTVIVDGGEMYYDPMHYINICKNRKVFTVHNAKKVINTKTNDIFNSIKAAAESIGIKKGTLAHRLNGRLSNNTPFQYYNTPELSITDEDTQLKCNKN